MEINKTKQNKKTQNERRTCEKRDITARRGHRERDRTIKTERRT